MPNVVIKNETPHTLNVALSQIAPLHFANEIAPGSQFKCHCGSVFFTFEWRIDNVSPTTLASADTKTLQRAIAHSNRYSAGKSARTIAIVSAAGLSFVALAGPAALSAAAAAGSATAASLLASSAILSAASTAEAIAFSSYAASTLTASALEAVAENVGISSERAASAQKQLDVLTTAITTTAAGGAAALKGPKKAILSAGTAIASKMAARSTKKANAEADAAVRKDGALLPPGKTERVFGVYVAFKPRTFAIREIVNDKGEKHTILWDYDNNKRVV